MTKLSQIAVGGTLVSGTQFVAVSSGPSDNLYTIDQIKSFVGGSTPPGGANTNVQFNNSGSFGGDSSFTYTTPGQITLTRNAGALVTFADGTLGSFATIGTDGFGDINIIPTNHNGNVNVQGVSGSGVNVGCLLPTLSQQAVFGLDSSNNPFVALGPGSANTDTYLGRSAANVWQMGGSATTFNGSLKLATILGGNNTVTTNTPILNLTQTWNNAATSFDSIFMNVTQTAAAVGSNLVDLQIGGKSQLALTNINNGLTNASLLLGTNVDPNFQGAGDPSQILMVTDGNITWGLSLLGINNSTIAAGQTQAKTRGNLTTPGAVATGDEIGAFYFLADDGTGVSGNMPNCARMFCFVDGAVGTNIMPGRLSFNTSDHGSADARFAERWRIDANGYLAPISTQGIGGYVATQSFGATTCTITIASPAVITLNNHGFLPQQQVQFSTTGSLPTGITAGTTYYVKAAGLTQNTFEIDTLPNNPAGFGGAVNTSGTQSGTQSVAAIGNNQFASTLAKFSFSGVSQLTNPAALTLQQTWNFTIVGTTAASGTGTVATLTFASLNQTPTVGSTVFISGVTPAGYNGTYVITAATNTTISYANTTTGAQTVAGAIQIFPDAFIMNAIQIAGFNGAILDVQTNGTTNFMVRSNSGARVLNGSSGASFEVYNTVDFPLNPVNYEKGVFDWTTTSNRLTIGTQAGGTGVSRDLSIVCQNGFIKSFVGGWFVADPSSGGAASGYLISSRYTVGSSSVFSFANNSDPTGSSDSGMARVAAKVASFCDGASNANGWMQWAGQSRVTSDVTFTSTTTLGTITGLSVNVQAGRTYKFTAELSWTDAAAGGIQAAIAGTCTATNIIYDGWVVDSAANGIKGNTQATALGTAVASTTTTGTAGHLTIEGTITVNAAGTLLVQAAQNTSNATATTIKRGSTFIVQDMP